MASNSEKKAYSSDNIAQQVEQSADLYQPSVYALLSFYHSINWQADPMDGQFIPMTTARVPNDKEVLLFAVGLIPPSSNVTGRLLDRSESIKAFFGSSLTTASELDRLGVEEARTLTDYIGPTMEPSRKVQAKNDKAIRSLHDSVQPLAKELIELASHEGINIVVTSGYRSVDRQNELYTKGRTKPGNVITGVRGGDSWHNYGLAFDVAMVSPGPKPPAGTPSWPPDKERWETLGNLGKTIGLTWGGSFSDIWDPGHFEFHPGLTKNQAARGIRPAVAEDPLPISGKTLNSNTSWAFDGSSNANKASKTASQKSDKSLNAENLGKRFQDQQQALINQTVNALNQIANTPPLRLLINPTSFRTSFEKIISDGNWGRNGHIIEHWGDNQDKIEGSGKIAGFYSIDASNANGPGLSRTARQFSVSYQNLLSLWAIYKNNGGVYLPDPLSPTESKYKNLSVLGSVYLYYDNILYIGSFDTFTLSETDEAPFTCEYSFAFTVRASFLLDHLDDSQYTYGSPQQLVPQIRIGSSTPPLSLGSGEQLDPNVALPEGS